MAKKRRGRGKRVAAAKASEENTTTAAATDEGETPRSSRSNAKSKAIKSTRKSSRATGADTNLVSHRIATKPGKLTKQDVTCPICWSIMVRPTTLPCNHSLCEACFKKHVEETSLCCPCCRLRVSIWSRKAFKENKFVDEQLWERIQNEFPRLVQARQDGIDSQFICDDVTEESPSSSPSLLDYCTTFDGTISDRPGEIRNELQQMLQQHQQDAEIERKREETASIGLIRQLQEEEAHNLQTYRSEEEKDFLLAQKLQEEFKAEQPMLSRSQQSQNNKIPRRNLMEDWVNSSSPDICELPRSSKSLSQQSRRGKQVSKKVTRSSTGKRAIIPKKKPSATITSGSLNVSRASQDVMSKFLSSSQSQSELAPNSSKSSYNVSMMYDDDNQPCSSSSIPIPKHDIRFSAFSPTKSSKKINIFVPSETLAVPVSYSPVDLRIESSIVLEKVEKSISATKTPDSIDSEVDRHFRPIRGAPKTPPRRRPDGTFLPEPKLFRSTPLRPTSGYIGTSFKDTPESSKSSCAISEKRISNDSGRASDDSGSPETLGVSPTSSLKGSDFISSNASASTSNADQIDRACSSDDYRVTPEDISTPKGRSKKRVNLNAHSDHENESPLNKKVKVEVEEMRNCDEVPLQYDISQVVKTEPRSPFKVDLACSQGIITIDADDQEYIDVEAEALERFRAKAQQEAADRAFAESLQRSFNRSSPRASRERYSLRSWLAPQVKQERD